MNRAGFWCEDYHRRHLHCVSCGSGRPMERDTSTGGVVLDVEIFSVAVMPSFKFRSALVAVMCHNSSCWDLVALTRRLAVWRWITHSPLPALLQPHEAQTSAPVIPGSWSSPSHPDTVTPTRHWRHEIKQQCSRLVDRLWITHNTCTTALKSATVITVTHTQSVYWLFFSGSVNVFKNTSGDDCISISSGQLPSLTSNQQWKHSKHIRFLQLLQVWLHPTTETLGKLQLVFTGQMPFLWLNQPTA